MNGIWTPQANVRFVPGELKFLKLKQALGDEVRYSDYAAISNAPGVATLPPDTLDRATRNVFFVWKIEGFAGYNPTGADGAYGQNIFSAVTVEPYDQGKLLAHEAGHSFQIRHIRELVNGGETQELKRFRTYLMHPLLYHSGPRIRFEEASVANLTIRPTR